MPFAAANKANCRLRRSLAAFLYLRVLQGFLGERVELESKSKIMAHRRMERKDSVACGKNAVERAAQGSPTWLA
jgi:hypothetical protein